VLTNEHADAKGKIEGVVAHSRKPARYEPLDDAGFFIGR
jgi:hypothetical protein